MNRSLLLYCSALLSQLFYASLAHPCYHVLKRDTQPGNASHILDQILESMSASETVHNIESFTFESSNIYRSQTLTQNYNLHYTDQSVASAGSQNLTFSIQNGVLLERVDRRYIYDGYWIWAFPDLNPAIGYSMVLQDSPSGYACFNEGQNSFFSADTTVALGFADGILTDYLVQQARQYALPWLLQRFIVNRSTLSISNHKDPITGVELLSINDEALGLSLILNSTSYLPHMVRSYEDSAMFGVSTSDMVFTNYSSVNMMQDQSPILLPHRIQVVYNSINVIEDFIIDQVTINPSLDVEFFNPRNVNNETRASAPTRHPEYPRSEVHEFFEAGLWGGPFGEVFNMSDVVIGMPLPNVTAIKSLYVGYSDYVQLLIEIGGDLLITDAPPHRSKIVIDWVRENMGGRKIKYVVPSHHHRDHAGGLSDYVAAGAIAVIPEIAKTYYEKVNNGMIEFITYNETSPFIIADAAVQFRSFWHDENPHARDWTYAVIGEACPSDKSQVLVYNADVVSPGFNPDTPTSEGLRWDTAFARQWLVTAARDGIPQTAILQGAHGATESNTGLLQRVIDVTGIDYPVLSPSGLCLDRD